MSSTTSTSMKPPHVERRCWECRRRRWVCDMAKPACQKCSDRGLVCPGYDQTSRPLRFVQPNSAKAFPRTGTDSPKTPNAPRHIQGKSIPSPGNTLVRVTTDPVRYFDNSDQAYGLQYFHESLTHARTGQFGQVWGHYILPLSLHQPAVKHAFASYGMLRANNQGLCTTISPLRVYCKSIESARKSLQHVWSPETALILCNVLWVTEFEVGNWASGLMHVLAGIRNFREWTPTNASSHLTEFLATSSAMYGSLPMELIWLTDLDSPFYATNRRQGKTTLNTTSPEWTALESRLPSYPQPKSFTSFNEAYETCREISSVIETWLSFLPEPHSSSSNSSNPATSLRQPLLTWCTTFLSRLTTFTTTTTKPPPLDNAERTFCTLLALRILACKTALASFCHSDEHNWDPSLPDFIQIVHVADALLKAGSPFTASTHTVVALLALLHTALKCRDAKIRREACGLLERCELGRGCRLGRDFGRVCRFIIQIEEGGDKEVEGKVGREKRVGFVGFEYGLKGLEGFTLWKRSGERLGGWVNYGRVGLRDCEAGLSRGSMAAALERTCDLHINKGITVRGSTSLVQQVHEGRGRNALLVRHQQ